jgi:hypothetical protein
MLAAAPRLARDEAGTASLAASPCRPEGGLALGGSGTHPVPSAVTALPGWRTEASAEAYCVKCKAKREVKNPTKIVMKNGKAGAQGRLPGVRDERLQDRRLIRTA